MGSVKGMETRRSGDGFHGVSEGHGDTPFWRRFQETASTLLHVSHHSYGEAY